MKTMESKMTYFKTNLSVLISAGIGGIFCVLCDYFAKGYDSLSLSMIQQMATHFYIPALLGFFIITLLLPLLSVALCFVFEPTKKLTAFYLGASILALLFNFTPMTDFDQLKTEKSSAKINITLEEPENREITSSLVTAKDRNTKAIVGQTKYNKNNFFFYLKQGNYQLFIEAPGYDIIVYNLDVLNDNDINLSFTLKPTIVPLQLQRLFIDY
jgi:hypothetical protein